MLYVKYFTIPKSTPVSSPVKGEVEIDGDMLERVYVLIPPGHYALAGLQIYYGELQIMPANIGEWLRGDNVVVNCTLDLELHDHPTKFVLKGYNEDERYDHTFYCYFVTREVKRTAYSKALRDVVQQIRRLIGL